MTETLRNEKGEMDSIIKCITFHKQQGDADAQEKYIEAEDLKCMITIGVQEVCSGFLCKDDQYLFGVRNKRGQFSKISIGLQKWDDKPQNQRESFKVSITMKEHIEDRKGIDSRYVAYCVTQNHLSSWRMRVDHPLVCYVNDNRPQEIIVASLVEKKEKRVLF